MVVVGLCRDVQDQSGVCKKPLLRQIKQRFVVLLLVLGKRSQVEHCPAELAWLLVPSVGCDPHQGLTTWICRQT